MIPESEWEWYGRPAHFIGGSDCRFHFATRIGTVVVSTVGDYQPFEGKPAMEIGANRFYETFVFRVMDETRCECGCGRPTIGSTEIDAEASNDAASATDAHRRMCAKWAANNSLEDES